MPSKRRYESKTGYYHVMSRGNNKSKIFDREMDYIKILQYVKRLVEDSSIQVYAYCVMPNHYHLLVRIPDTISSASAYKGQGLDDTGTANHPSVSGLSKAMHRINTAYSHYYMASHNHIGHVFQGSFRSREINDEEYLKNVIRYIHLNPVKASITRLASEYQWSSYWEYIRKAHRNILLGDGEDLLRQYGFHNIINFKAFHDSTSSTDLDDMYLDLEDKADIMAEELDYAHLLIAQAKSKYLSQTLDDGIEGETVDHLQLSDLDKLSDIIKDHKVRMELAQQIINGTSTLSCRSIAQLTNVDRNRLKRSRPTTTGRKPQTER